MSETRPPRWPAPPAAGCGTASSTATSWTNTSALLAEAVRTVDLLDHEVRRDVPTIDSPRGLRAHPAAVEARQQRIALARLISALRLPDDNVGVRRPPGRPQRRTGVRGVYSVGGA
ncbi:hypothetical protein [Blastococcus mobilis]|uniref:hypothetical protein n=1 Tax=Blastococcus mobilis TaxID=1938746 RepID=UPI001C3C4FF0|nr:hypothetical protein [Blastococcus mobilis]